VPIDGGSSADSDALFEGGAPDAGDGGRRVPIQLSAGTDYACALFSDATVSCWGDPGDGRLGGPYADPTPVPGAVADQQISAGGFAECLLSKAGAVSCLGDDWYGAVGDGHSGEGDIVTTPTLIMPSGVTYVSMGDSFGCALAMNGAVSCWGYNAAGQIGPGGGSTGLGQVHPTPTLVSDLPQAGMIATGLSHACALSLDRQTVSCWGEGYYGQLGDGMSGSGYVRATPAPVVGLPAGVSTIAAGGGDSCAITDGGALWCWGANDQAQLGTGAPGSPVTNPTRIPGLESIAQTSPGSNDEICAVTTSGATYCWGLDNVGASEPDAALNYFAPTLVTGVPAAKQVATGNDFGCVLGVDSTVWCWGANYEGQCGPLASGMVVPTPVQVPF
jgi:alpha-tubulin suppressor-like RCC1 family protein